MQVTDQHGKILTVRNGYLICPNCRRNRRLMKILPDAHAQQVVAYCHDCKTESILHITKGQSLEGRNR